MPTKRATPSEYTVIAVVASCALILIGMAAVMMGFLAPPEKHALAVAAIRYGCGFIGAGVAIAVGFALWRRFVR